LKHVGHRNGADALHRVLLSQGVVGSLVALKARHKLERGKPGSPAGSPAGVEARSEA